MRESRLLRLQNSTIYRTFMENQLEETPEYMSMLREHGCHCINSTSVHDIIPNLLESRKRRLVFVYTNSFLRRKLWGMNAFQSGRLGSFQVKQHITVQQAKKETISSSSTHKFSLIFLLPSR